jgi:hypothetical protein
MSLPKLHLLFEGSLLVQVPGGVRWLDGTWSYPVSHLLAVHFKQAPKDYSCGFPDTLVLYFSTEATVITAPDLERAWDCLTTSQNTDEPIPPQGEIACRGLAICSRPYKDEETPEAAG